MESENGAQQPDILPPPVQLFYRREDAKSTGFRDNVPKNLLKKKPSEQNLALTRSADSVYSSQR